MFLGWKSKVPTTNATIQFPVCLHEVLAVSYFSYFESSVELYFTAAFVIPTKRRVSNSTWILQQSIHVNSRNALCIETYFNAHPFLHKTIHMTSSRVNRSSFFQYWCSFIKGSINKSRTCVRAVAFDLFTFFALLSLTMLWEFSGRTFSPSWTCGNDARLWQYPLEYHKGRHT